MLRITEKEDYEDRKREVDAVVETWKRAVAKVPNAVLHEFRSKLMISLIYHDAALEGEVLSHSEIQAATDTTIISDSSLIPSYESITNFHSAASVALQLAKQEPQLPIGVPLIKQLYGILDPAAGSSDHAYRKENPLHRLYYHSIAQPDDVKAEMKKLDKWFQSTEFTELPPIEKAAYAHHRLMGVFPWLKESGRLSRILSLMILEQEGYPLAVIHSIDRQAYYEALRATDMKAIHRLYLEAVETTATSSMRVYEEAASFHRAS